MVLQNRFNPFKSTFETTEEEKSVWAFVEKRYEEGKEARPDADWSRWLDLYNFKHWKEKRPTYKASIVTNFCFSNVETVVPIMTDQPPRVHILPQEDNDIKYAEVMRQVLDYVWTSVCDLDYLLPNVLRTTMVLGTSFAKVNWNKEKGVLGDIEVIPLKPESVYIDPNAREVEDAAFVIIAETKTLEEIRELYPEQGGRVLPDKTSSSPRDSALLLECWFRDRTVEEHKEKIELAGEDENLFAKRKKYPRGRVIIAANRVILKDKHNPYKDGKFPFVRFVDHPRTHSVWGIGEIEPIESLQLEHNKRKSQVIDIMNLMSNPIWIIDKQAGVDVNNLTNRPGLVVQKNRGTDVRREEPPRLPPHVLQSIQHTESNIDTISGIHDVTQGRKPTGVTAASSILELQEAAQVKLRLKTRYFEASLRVLAKMIISRIQQFYTEDRLIRLVSPESAPQIFMFSSSMEITDEQTNKKRNPFKQNFDIKIATGSTLPVSKTARAQQGQMLFTLNAIDQEALLEAYDWPNRKAIIERMNAARQAQMEASYGAQQLGPGMEEEGEMMPPGGMGQEGMVPQGGPPLGPGQGPPNEEVID